MNKTFFLDTDNFDDLLQQVSCQFSHYQDDSYHYLDSAATTQKPDSVIEAISHGYRNFSAPVHRASYPDSETASSAYEQAREKVASFIHAQPKELIFTKSAMGLLLSTRIHFPSSFASVTSSPGLSQS